MKKFYTSFLVAFISILSIAFSGCSQEEPINEVKEENDLKNLYQLLSNQPSYSLLSLSETYPSRSSLHGLPKITKDDISFLKTLSQEEFMDLQTRLSDMGVTENSFDEISAINQYKLYEILGGNNGVNKLMEFSSAYLKSKGGFNHLFQLLPKDLKENEAEYYIAMAIYN